MPHEIMRHDGLVLNRVPAWHGLGLVMGEAPTPEEALEAANLNWRVGQYKLRGFGTGECDGDEIEIPSDVANVRLGNPKLLLGVVGKGYVPFQNQALMELCNAFADEGLTPKIESAGSLRNGRVVFFLAQTGSFYVGSKNDEVRQYLLITNSHDGTLSICILPTDIRVVCKNTHAAAMSEGLIFQFKHTPNVIARVEEAKPAIHNAIKTAKKMEEMSKALGEKPMTEQEMNEFFLKVYQKSYGAIPSNPKNRSEENRRNRSIKVISKWQANLQMELDVREMERSLWTAVNSITEWSDHDRTVRVTENAGNETEQRHFSNLFGSSAQFKAGVFNQALQLV